MGLVVAKVAPGQVFSEYFGIIYNQRKHGFLDFLEMGA
jgi:hypothetical protein